MIDPRNPDFSFTPVAPARPAMGYAPVDPAATPCVSIVTPFFNTGREFRETARSVFGQSLQQWEWIIVNDASTDAASLAMLAEYRTGDVRVRVVDHAQNKGLSAARNTGWRAARSPYIVLLDSDDLLETTAVEKWFWHLATFSGHAFVKGFGVGFGAQEYLWQRGFHEHEAFLEENIVDATAMVRRSILERTGGFDESTRGGLEDWDFWLHAASLGFWGGTIPEYLNWYRRRAEHTDRWSNLETSARADFRTMLRARYPRLWEGGFPKVTPGAEGAYAEMRDELPAANRLRRERRRLLMLVPWLAMGGADKFNLDLISQLRNQGWDVTVASTAEGDHAWLPEFARLTPDVFPLDHFLRLADYPRFLAYLIASRGIETVMVTNSELGYKLVPYLRSRFPAVTFVDYCHMEEEEWNNGGYPRLAVQMQEVLDLNITSSAYLREWESRRGGDPTRIEVCTTNIDTAVWRPDPDVRARERAALGIDDRLPVILFSGRIVAQKQPAVLLEAVRLLHERGVTFLALVAGDGVDRERIEARARALQLGDVLRFLGPLANEKVRQLMLASDILFLPSAWEGIALTVYEAMAAGIVVVGAAVGGQAELVTEQTGVLIRRSTPSQEAQEYAAILGRLVSDPAERRRLANGARERVTQRFSLSHMGDRMVELFGRARALHDRQPREQISIGLGRSTALEALEAHRNRPNRWWYTGITDGADAVLALVHQALAKNDRGTAVTCLRAVRALFVRAEDKERVMMIDARIAEVEGLLQTDDTNAPPLVSVVIPCYNQAEYLAEAMASVVAQTDTRWEMVVVNDGSPDDTSAVAQAFMAAHPDRRIRLIEQANRGVSAARNAGCRAARGAFLLPLDADDRIAPGFIATCLGALEQSSRTGFAYTSIRRFGLVDEVFVLPPFDAHTVVHEDNTVAVCALLRRSMWEEVGGWNESMTSMYEDWDFWVGCIEKGWTGICIPEPLFEYRIKASGALANANERRMHLIARIVTNHPSMYEAKTRAWAAGLLADTQRTTSVAAGPLGIVYLVHNIQGVTGGNQTLLHHVNALAAKGHDVTIVTYSEPPSWKAVHARIVRVPQSMPLAAGVPRADAVIATYFLNAFELERIDAPVKIYFAQGDQFIFDDRSGAGDGPWAQQSARMRDMSAASYRIAGVNVVANSRTLQRMIRAHGGQAIEPIVPVCVDQTVFHPVERVTSHTVPRILVVGPDSAGTRLEPLTFKGIGDIREALTSLRAAGEHFEVVRISNTPPEIFRSMECEFHQAPADDEKTRLFGTADILVYGSHYDSCPRPPLEGMAAGLAVVCTATDGAMEYCVQGVNALLVPPARPDELAMAIRALVHDEALRARLAEGGMRTAQERPAELEWQTMLSVITTVLPASVRSASVPGRATTATETEQILVSVAATDGPGYARSVNQAWRESKASAIAVLRDDVTVPDGTLHRLVTALTGDPQCAAVLPAILPDAVAQPWADPEAYTERAKGRREPCTTLPAAAWMVRRECIATAGLLDETLPTINAVLDDLASRILLEGHTILAIGECAVSVPDAGTGPVMRSNARITRMQHGSMQFDAASREALRALTTARVFEETGRLDDAVAELDAALDHVPGSPRLHAERAWMLLRADQYQRVSDLLGPTPDSVKRNPVWLEIAGFAMQGIGEHILAAQCADKALALNPRCARALVIKGMLAVDQGNVAAAEKAFRDAAVADPTLALAPAHLGALLWVTGRREEACSQIERGFILDPADPVIMISYRDMVHETQGYAQALINIRDARMYHPDHRALALVHAEVLSGMNDPGGALEVLIGLMADQGPAQEVLTMALELRTQKGPMGQAPVDGVSLCMIVKDEEPRLARCLADAALFVDEIVVVDTGSTDRTVEVAIACGARVHSVDWNNDYAAARNAAVAHAHGGWILSLDADERLSVADHRAFVALMASLRATPAGAVFTTRNYVADAGVEGWRRNDGAYAEEAGAGWIPSDKVRLFPRSAHVLYEQPVHEVVEASLQRAGIPLIRAAIPVHHYGRLDTQRTREKASQYAEIGRRKLAQGGSGDLRAVRELAAQEQELGNHTAAIPLWQQVVRLDPSDARAALGLGVSLAAEGRYAEALPELERSSRMDPSKPEAIVKHALTALECGDVRTARRSAEAARVSHPEYPFAIAAHAAVLACAGDRQGASHAADDLRCRGIDGHRFFVQVAQDLAHAGQEELARSLMQCFQLTEGMAVAP
jgi:glycosyltransferase involved in cell wall biosynthesis/Flp pilus assembly protein TadD